MKTIDINLRELKDTYEQRKPIVISDIKFFIARTAGAIREWRLFHSGSWVVVFEYDKESGFIVLS